MSDEHPITLASAAKEFGFTVPTLRAEADKGRLSVYKIGRRLYTTRTDIFEMVEKCRVQAKGRDYTSIRDGASGSSEMERISSARAALRATLTGRDHA
jgi:hypothetical protein